MKIAIKLIADLVFLERLHRGRPKTQNTPFGSNDVTKINLHDTTADPKPKTQNLKPKWFIGGRT
jgi:hypothetical protein